MTEAIAARGVGGEQRAREQLVQRRERLGLPDPGGRGREVEVDRVARDGGALGERRPSACKAAIS